MCTDFFTYEQVIDMAFPSHTLLMISPDADTRSELSATLRQEFALLEAADAAQTMQLVDENRGTICAVLLDLSCPEQLDGFALLGQSETLNVPIIAIVAYTESTGLDVLNRAMECGVVDFISKPFQKELTIYRIKSALAHSQIHLLRELRHTAEHDALTGLYNRKQLFSAIRTLLDENPQTRFLLLRLDIDGFSVLNSFWGSEKGDRFLIYIADLLKRALIKIKLSAFGRIGADVFCVCMPYDPGTLRQSQEDLVRHLAEFDPDSAIKPSIGVYIIDEPELSVDVMYDRASMAAKSSKALYDHGISFYDPSLAQQRQENQSLIDDMAKALEQHQFLVYFQPKYNLLNHQPCGAEALVRWKHPTRGVISPGQFVPLFERNGTIGKLDYYIWEETCRLLRSWIDKGLSPLPVSVNMSRADLYNPRLVSRLNKLMKKYDLTPSLLHLELTESAYTADQDRIRSLLHSLHEAGYTILMDDFGSGYSSLNALQDLSVDVLKIGAEFLTNSDTSDRSSRILASVIRMAGWLEMPLVVEGVETQAQCEFLQSVGCVYAQGFYFARPMPAEDYEIMLQLPSDNSLFRRTFTSHDLVETVWPSDEESNRLFFHFPLPLVIFAHTQSGEYSLIRLNRAYEEQFADIISASPNRSSYFMPNIMTQEAREQAAAAMKRIIGTGESAAVVCRCEMNGRQTDYHVLYTYLGRNATSHIYQACILPENTAIGLPEANERDAVLSPKAAVRLREQLYRDELTGAFNRRYLRDVVSARLLDDEEDGRVTLIMMDVQDFKRINDDYGHLAGDHVLRQVATTLRAHVRAGDRVVRLGGDEFLIVMPHCPDTVVQGKIRELRQAMETIRYAGHEEFPVRGNFGYASADRLSVHGMTLERLMDQADQMMYQEKRACHKTEQN